MPSRSLARARTSAASALVAAIALFTSISAAALPANPERISASDRYATSAAVGEELFISPTRIYLASGKDFPDALSGGALSAINGSPLYLVGDGLSAEVSARLEAAPEADVVILGGEGSVSADLAAQVDALVGEVSRLSGADRYATSAAISQEAFPAGNSLVFVASGEVFADALAGAPAAAYNNAPVLLVRPGSVPSAIGSELERLDPDTIIVLGGAGSVGANVVEQLQEWGEVERIAGSTRWETSARIADELFPRSMAAAVIASGQQFPDALSATAATGSLRAPLLLVSRDAIDASVVERIRSLNPRRLVVIGGMGSVSEGVLRSLGEIEAD